MTIKALYLHGYQTVGEVVVVMGVADPVALPLLGLDLDGEHAWQGGEGGVKVGGGAGAVDAWSRRWEATRATFLLLLLLLLLLLMLMLLLLLLLLGGDPGHLVR